jgi:Flp pilus assembly protein TadD
VKLAESVPTRFEYASDAGVCLESLGDSSAAARWYARAAALPGADDEARRNAERFAHLRGRQ